MDALIRQLNDLCDTQPFHTGWYLKNLRTGAAADRHGNVIVPSASTRKIAIMMTALQGVNAGDFALDQPVTIQAKYQNNNSGCFQHLRPGFTITFQDALVMMIIVSDNTCTGTVADMVGLDRVNALCRSIGMTGTTHRHGMPPAGLRADHAVDATNATTPADVGLLLECILAGTRNEAAAARLGCTPAHCQLGLDILSWQKLNARMPMLMPPGTKIAHKTGTGARNYNDAGIVFQGEDPLFILTVYTENVPEEVPSGLPGATAAQQTIAALTRACWDALKA
jgi:beta-lactamase class A